VPERLRLTLDDGGDVRLGGTAVGGMTGTTDGAADGVSGLTPAVTVESLPNRPGGGAMPWAECVSVSAADVVRRPWKSATAHTRCTPGPRREVGRVCDTDSPGATRTRWKGVPSAYTSTS
jgi:hypothetical protein